MALKLNQSQRVVCANPLEQGGFMQRPGDEVVSSFLVSSSIPGNASRELRSFVGAKLLQKDGGRCEVAPDDVTCDKRQMIELQMIREGDEVN